MLRDEFFIENEVFFQDERINSIRNFEKYCSQYDIEEHQGRARNNKLYLKNIDGKGKISIILTGGGNEVKVDTGNRVNRRLQIVFSGIFGKSPREVKIEIGKNNLFNGNVTIVSPVQKDRCVHIGNHNLFANGVLFLGRNDHGIFDKNTHELLNKDYDIICGDRNWICKDTEFYPKAVIQDDSVVAAHTVVNKEFRESNILVAGIPGTVKKRNIIWNVSCDVLNLEENLSNPLHRVCPN